MERHPKSYYTEIIIRFCDCDAGKRAKIETILQHMSDIAGIAYASKGYTHQWLWERNSVFLVTRASVRIHRMPTQDEHLIVETWERCIEKLLYYRDFAFYDAQGEKIIEGQTAWVVVDPQTRRIQRPADFPGTFDPDPDRQAQTLPPARLKPAPHYETAGYRKILYSDIDANQHTYNAVYAGIACDYLPPEWMKRKLRDFRIQFKQEACWGETLEIRTCLEDSCAKVLGMLGEVVSFECEFYFES